MAAWIMAVVCKMNREAGRRTLLWRCLANPKFLTFQDRLSSFTLDNVPGIP